MTNHVRKFKKDIEVNKIIFENNDIIKLLLNK